MAMGEYSWLWVSQYAVGYSDFPECLYRQWYIPAQLESAHVETPHNSNKTETVFCLNNTKDLHNLQFKLHF